MSPYPNTATKSNVVTKLSDHRQPKPAHAGFIDDNPLAFACGRREPDEAFMARNPRRDFRADTALPEELEATGLSPLPKGQVALRLCGLAPKIGCSEAPVLLTVSEDDIDRINEAVAGSDPELLDQLRVTYSAIQSEFYDGVHLRDGRKSLVAPKRCFAWDGLRWEGRTMLTPAVPAYDPFDPYDEPPSKAPTRFEDRIRPFSLTHADLAKLPRREWVVDNALARGLLSQVVAPGSAGKSLYMIQLGVAVAKGDGAFMGIQVNEPCRVLIVNLEDDMFEQHRRLMGVLQHFRIPCEDLHGRLFLYDQSGDGSSVHVAKRDAKKQIVEGPDLEAIIAYVRQHKIDVVLLDPLVELHQANEVDNSELIEVMKAFKKLARVTSAAIMFAHHTRKPDKASAKGHAGDVDTGRGGTAISNATRVTQTLFAMTAGEAKALSIPDMERGRYVRLDDAKTNYCLASPRARWFKKLSVTLPNGDSVGILDPISFSVDRAADCQLLTTNLMVAALTAGRQLSPKARASNSAVQYLADNQGDRDFSKKEFGEALELLNDFDFAIEVYKSGGKEAQRYVLLRGRFADGSGQDG